MRIRSRRVKWLIVLNKEQAREPLLCLYCLFVSFIYSLGNLGSISLRNGPVGSEQMQDSATVFVFTAVVTVSFTVEVLIWFHAVSLSLCLHHLFVVWLGFKTVDLENKRGLVKEDGCSAGLFVWFPSNVDMDLDSTDEGFVGEGVKDGELIWIRLNRSIKTWKVVDSWCEGIRHLLTEQKLYGVWLLACVCSRECVFVCKWINSVESRLDSVTYLIILHETNMIAL